MKRKILLSSLLLLLIIATLIYFNKQNEVIQLLDIQNGSWKTHAIDYATEAPISVAIVITIVKIIYGIFQVVNIDRIKKYFKY